MAGAVDSETPGVEYSTPAQPAQFEGCAIGISAVDVREVRSEPDVDGFEFGPAGSGVVVETGSETVLDRLRGPLHPLILAVGARSGGDRSVVVASTAAGVEPLEHGGQIAPGEPPVEGSGGLVVVVLETFQAIFEGG